jgi:hypothetical protein
MKIAFIYSYLENETWSTPLSLATEFQSRGWEVNIYSIISAAGNYTESGIQLMFDEIAGGYKPDIIFYLDWGRFDSPLLDCRKYPDAFWIQESGDDPQNYTRNFPKSERFNLILSPDYVSAEKYKESGRHAIWWTHFSDSTIHYPDVTIIPKYDAVSTRGRGSSDVLDTLSSVIPKSFLNSSGHVGIDHASALQMGKLVVQHARWGEITRRIFEAMACGKMVLTDRLLPERHMDDLFKENVDIVYYNDIEECLEKIDYYSKNDHEREKIANSGRQKVIKSHTQYQRVKTILEEFREWKNDKKIKSK